MLPPRGRILPIVCAKTGRHANDEEYRKCRGAEIVRSNEDSDRTLPPISDQALFAYAGKAAKFCERRPDARGRRRSLFPRRVDAAEPRLQGLGLQLAQAASQHIGGGEVVARLDARRHPPAEGKGT